MLDSSQNIAELARSHFVVFEFIFGLGHNIKMILDHFPWHNVN